MRSALFALAVLAAGPSFAQGAAEDPCALTLYHYDRAAEIEDNAGRAYQKTILSMVSVASTAIEAGIEDTLRVIRANCAHNPARPFAYVVSGVVDARREAEARDFRSEIRDLKDEITGLEGKIEGLESGDALEAREEVKAAQARATASQKQVAEERKKIEVLRARISELIAERDALRQ